jgi:hypothetical protein
MTRKASPTTGPNEQAEGAQAESASPSDRANPRARLAPAPASKAESANKGERPSRRDQLIRMLSTRSGADLAAISARFGWLPHTTRAALSGLRKSGHAVVTEKRPDGKPTRYRIATQAGTAAPDDPALLTAQLPGHRLPPGQGSDAGRSAPGEAVATSRIDESNPAGGAA